MIPGRVSIVLPCRNEQFLPKTVADIIAKARGDIEVVPVLDGYWPAPMFPTDDKRIVVLHKGLNEGMRPAINDGIRVSTGEYILKCDGHVMFDEGFDVKLKADMQPNWVVIPRRVALEPLSWTIEDTRKGPIDFHYLSYPYERPGDPSCGLHGTPYRRHGEKRTGILIDDEMSSQGSAWFTTRQWWDRIGEGDVVLYGNFIQEFQEVGLKTWLGGGEVKVNKKTWYAHFHKGPRNEQRPHGGRGYYISKSEMEKGSIACIDHWMHDRWPGRVHPLRWLIEKFNGIMDGGVPTWPTDLDEAFRPRHYVPTGNGQSGGRWELVTA